MSLKKICICGENDIDLKRIKNGCIISKYVFIGTGLSLATIPNDNIVNIYENSIGYEDLTLNSSFWKNKKVLIIGSGNSGLETAKYISQFTASTHIYGNVPKFAFSTHYVGHVRAINLEFIDHYLLKSNDAIFGAKKKIKITRIKIQDKYKYKLDQIERNETTTTMPNAYRELYDVIVRCTGFHFDYSIFDNSLFDINNKNDKSKYPSMTDSFEMVSNINNNNNNNNNKSSIISNLYFIGVLMHSRDYKRSSGGFIHGWRYLVQSLYNQIFSKYKIEQIKLNQILIKFM